MTERPAAGSPDRPTVAFVVAGGVVGGHEHQAYRFVEDLLAQADVKVVCASSPVARYFETLPCPVVLEPYWAPGMLLRQVARAGEVAARLRPHLAGAQVVVASGGTLEATVSAVYACRRAAPGARCIAYVPMFVSRAEVRGALWTPYDVVAGWVGRRADAYCTVNRIQARILARRFGRPTHVLPNVVREVAPPTSDPGKRLVYVGRFDDEQKGLLELLSLLDRPENPYDELVLIGAGPIETALRAKARSLRRLRTTFLPWMGAAEMDEAIGRGDCLVLNSRWEGEPLVVREFAARGLPCVGRNIDGLRGITSRRSRFGDEQELLQVLQAAHAGRLRPPHVASPAWVARRRAQAIREMLAP
jgi:glycosyltransferase involved in cell wall biosynthesis